MGNSMSYKQTYQRTELLIDVERDITPGLPAVDRAIAFVRTRGRVTSSQLHAVMDLPDDELPSEHLADALEDKRLIKDGKYWTLGAAKVVPVVESAIVEAEAA